MTDPLNALAAHASDARRMLAQDKDPSRVTVAALAEGVPALVAELDEVRAEARRVLAHAVTYNWHSTTTPLRAALGAYRADLERADRFYGTGPAIAMFAGATLANAVEQHLASDTDRAAAVESLLAEAGDMENRGEHTPAFTQGIRYAAAHLAETAPTPSQGTEVPGWVGEVLSARAAAHAKHGPNSIEALDYADPRWLAILMEEVGEVAHELTYDAEPTWDQPLDVDERARAEARRVRAELLDVLAVASAWLDAADRSIDGAS